MPAIVVPPGEETTLNMTPMIDIVFQLVVFFMLTLDMSSKDYIPLTLPFAHHAVEDKDDPSDPIQNLKVVVNVLPNGKIVLKGKEYAMTQDDMKGSMEGLKALHRELVLATQPDPDHPNIREEDQHSKVAIQVHGDRAALWRYVQWIIATASSPQVKMYKIYFSVKQPQEEAAGTAPKAP
jgi:biopolymer transport protein ExbD